MKIWILVFILLCLVLLFVVALPIASNNNAMYQSQLSEDRTLAPPATTTEQVMAWMYPYNPACSAALEYTDGRTIDILKPEFFTVTGGNLVLLDDTKVTCNGYSPVFIADLKQHSTQQFVTVSSASTADMSIFLNQALSSSTDIETLVTFVVSNNLTGIELNFEDFGNWNHQHYLNFKTFVTRLGNSLHSKNKKLMVVGPPIANATEEAWFLWRYEDFTHFPIDFMVVMGYDYQYDHGVGQPIAPLEWLQNVIIWISARYPKEKLTIGLPSYGYEGKVGTHEFSILTYEEIKTRPGFAGATRDTDSAEMTWRYNDIIYFYQDNVSLTRKRDLVHSLGIHSISVWHLGGNLWFE